jgi:hypothetical protein
MLPRASVPTNIFSWIFVPALFSSLAVSPVIASELTAIGGVQALDCKGLRLELLGIKFQGDFQAAKAICGLKSESHLPYVAVVAEIDAAGVARIKSVARIAQLYVPGASHVYLRGVVSEVRANVGLVSISGAYVVATYQLPSKGSVVEVVGIQPVIGGVVLPSELIPLSNNSIGTGINSSIGTGVNSSIGTGINGSISTAINSSIGTGINSSIGTGINSSIGTGINSSVGTGMNSSIGTGINSSIGTGLNSSIGTGRNN